MERQLLFDYGFLLAYWLMFVGLAVIVARRPGAEYEAAALGAALAATATALLDVLENVRTRGLLALSRPGDQVRRQPVEHLRQTSLAKWFASAVTLAVLAVGFLTAESGQRFPGLAFLAVAVLGFCAIALDRLIPVYLAALFVLGVALAVWFTFDSAGAVAHL